MKYIIFFLVFFSVFSANAGELDRYQKISTLMMNNIDHAKKNCGLSKDESSAMLNAVRAKTDSRFQKLEDIGNEKSIKALAKSCNKTCGCDFYQILIDRFGANYQSLFPTKKLNSINCNKALLSVCKTAEFKKLKADLKDFLPAAGM